MKSLITCDARYVSAPEAMWRLLEFPMHDRSHAVIRLPVHLPQQQRITFEEGHEEEALYATLIHDARTGITKLTVWFALNAANEDSREFLYTEIPYHYVYSLGTWKKRQRGAEKMVARMYTVGANEQERFCLRLLLLHVPGMTSFQDLRTVNGVEYQTFKEAAFHRNLLDTDEEWEKCLDEAVTFKMPSQMRQAFAFICVFCVPTNALALWEKFKLDLALDFLRDHDNEAAYIWLSTT
jgi:hypothetical protein